MASTGVFELLAGTALASADVLPFVDVSDSTQAPQGSLVKITVTNFFATVPVPIVVTSASANALAVGLNGATNPALTVDASTALQVAGLKVTGAVTGGTVAVVVTDSGLNASLTINAKGTGTIGIGSVSTGRVTITPVTTITGLLTLSAGATVNGTLTQNGQVQITSTSAGQLTVRYDGSNNLSIDVSSAGLVTYNASGASAGHSFSDLITATAGLTVSSGQTLTVTGATITGLTAASVGAGTFPSGAFAFQGAVSGATTLQTSGNVAFGGAAVASIPGWSANYSVLAGKSDNQFTVAFGGISGDAMHLSDASYFDGANWKYAKTQAVSNIYLSTGAIGLRVAASGTAGTNITWVNAITVAATTGNVSMAGTLGVASDFAVNTSKFTVAAASGNTVVAGTLNVSSNAKISTADVYFQGVSPTTGTVRDLIGVSSTNRVTINPAATLVVEIGGLVNLTSIGGISINNQSVIGLDASNDLQLWLAGQQLALHAPSTRTTIGANGAASALTANPVGYLDVAVGDGTTYQIPYYNRGA